MVACGLEGVGEPGEDSAVVVMDLRGLPVHDAVGSAHHATKDVADALMSEAHSQQGDAPGELPDDVVGDARLGWRAWSGRDEDAVRAQALDLLESDLIVPENHRILSQLA